MNPGSRMSAPPSVKKPRVSTQQCQNFRMTRRQQHFGLSQQIRKGGFGHS